MRRPTAGPEGISPPSDAPKCKRFGTQIAW
jgi:hypothetical protein